MNSITSSKAPNDDHESICSSPRVTPASPASPHDSDGEYTSGEDDDGLAGYDSDSQVTRIAVSAASFARRCFVTGELAKALPALQNVVQVANPATAAYVECVVLLAQLFQLSGHVDASLQCVLGVHKCMPAPYTAADGLVIIARLYERKSARALAALWWNKLFQQQGRKPTLQQQQAALADLAARSFAQQDFVFALDAHHELFYKYSTSELSYAFLHKYLFSALHVREPAANHKLERLQLAWGLAHKAASLCDHPQHKHKYSDPDLYNLRNVYFAHFPAIYRLVFAWDDAPARVIALWWRTCREWRLSQCQAEVDPPPVAQQQPQNRKDRAGAGTKSPSRAQAKSPESIRLHVSPKPSRVLSKTQTKQAAATRDTRLAIEECNETRGTVAAKLTNQSDESTSRNPKTRSSVTLPPVTQSLERSTPNAKRRGRISKEQHQDDGKLYENSPTKRKLGAVRRLRTQNLVDELLHFQSPSSVMATSGDRDDQDTDDLHPPRTLLEVYALPAATAPAFLEATGREPGFADLDLDALERYVRVAHYRARVLTQQHVAVTSLSEECVKPQWLLAFEKVESMVATLQQIHQQPRLAGGDGDSPPTPVKPHLTQIHSRVVFQLTAILKLYIHAFGNTGFTRELHALIQRLSVWEYDQVSVLLAAMTSVRQAGVSEEKQRNLEFYHVHEGRKQLLG